MKALAVILYIVVGAAVAGASFVLIWSCFKGGIVAGIISCLIVAVILTVALTSIIRKFRYYKRLEREQKSAEANSDKTIDK